LYFDAVTPPGHSRRADRTATLDDHTSRTSAAANTEALIKDDVFALFGYIGTPTSLAALPLVNQNKMPFFGPFTGAEALPRPFSRYVFHVRASYYDETAAIIKTAAHTRALKRWRCFRQTTATVKPGSTSVVRR